VIIMAASKIAITIDGSLLKKIDGLNEINGG
jgi:hypothetical protein